MILICLGWSSLIICFLKKKRESKTVSITVGYFHLTIGAFSQMTQIQHNNEDFKDEDDDEGGDSIKRHRNQTRKPEGNDFWFSSQLNQFKESFGDFWKGGEKIEDEGEREVENDLITSFSSMGSFSSIPVHQPQSKSKRFDRNAGSFENEFSVSNL